MKFISKFVKRFKSKISCVIEKLSQVVAKKSLVKQKIIDKYKNRKQKWSNKSGFSKFLTIFIVVTLFLVEIMFFAISIAIETVFAFLPLVFEILFVAIAVIFEIIANILSSFSI
jgi:hypothetical protein